MSDSPNIIVIMTDQQKATASHLYGNTFCETPAMARLAEDGVLFEHAFTPLIPYVCRPASPYGQPNSLPCTSLPSAPSWSGSNPELSWP